jgi:hypothetical protein
MIPTYIIILLGLLGLIVIVLLLRKPTIEHFASSSKQTIILDSLGWIKPLISECIKTPNKVALISIELDKMREGSPVKCYGLGTTNLDDVFQKKNTKTILTGKKGTVALLWSEKDGKGRLLGMIPNPNGTRGFFQKTNMMAKSITVKKRTEISTNDLDNLEFVLPPRRWTCVKNDNKWYPKVASEVYGNVDEDKRPVKCSTNGRAYFADEKAKFSLYKKPLHKSNPKILAKKQLAADLQQLRLNKDRK